MPDEEQQIPPSDIVERAAQNSIPSGPDATAVRESAAITSGNYHASDAEDSYLVRKALKKRVVEHSCAIFRTIYGIAVFIFAIYAIMGGRYVSHLWKNPTELGEALQSSLTHLLAAGFGFFAWAWFGPKTKGPS